MIIKYDNYLYMTFEKQLRTAERPFYTLEDIAGRFALPRASARVLASRKIKSGELQPVRGMPQGPTVDELPRRGVTDDLAGLGIEFEGSGGYAPRSRSRPRPGRRRGRTCGCPGPGS